MGSGTGGGEGEGGGGEGEGNVTATRASDLHVDTHCCAKLPEAGGCKETSTEVASRLKVDTESEPDGVRSPTRLLELHVAN